MTLKEGDIVLIASTGEEGMVMGKGKDVETGEERIVVFGSDPKLFMLVKESDLVWENDLVGELIEIAKEANRPEA